MQAPFLRYILIATLVVFTQHSYAQIESLYKWRSMLTYYNPTDVTFLGSGRVFVTSEVGAYIFDRNQWQSALYNKVNGMHDVQPTRCAYDDLTETVVITYKNSNIDLFYNDRFFNIPDIKNNLNANDKSINNIFIKDGHAYLSTGLGVININLNKKEIKETIVISKDGQTYKANSTLIVRDTIYIATDMGLLKTAVNNPQITNIAQWTTLDTNRIYTHLCAFNNQIILSTKDSLFAYDHNNIQFVYAHNSETSDIIADNQTLYITTYNTQSFEGRTIILNTQFQTERSIHVGAPRSLTIDNYNNLYLADEYYGLGLYDANSSSFGFYAPNAPAHKHGFDLIAENNTVYMVHGGHNDKTEPYRTTAGISIYKQGEWNHYGRNLGGAFSDIEDLVCLKKASDGTLFAASFNDGLYILDKDLNPSHIKDTNILEPSVKHYPAVRANGLAIDKNNVLWMTLHGSPHELIARKPSGEFLKFHIPIIRNVYEYNAGRIVIADDGNKWYTAPYGGGVMVYSDNGTIDNPNDDQYRLLETGVGRGNLPSLDAQCIVKDLDGQIWIGTKAGIGIVGCPSRVFSGQCEAEIRIVQYDDYAGKLFEYESVNTIAVDAANRKWVGTNNGVWLLSEQASNIIERFHFDNSPLPSNTIQNISIDHGTGEVYISTDMGTVIYRGDAITGEKGETATIQTFPNPIKSGYTGTIAFKGLHTDAFFYITDINGKLVYKGQANGGQGTWDGKDYTGHRPQSGVYLIYTTDRFGERTAVGKFMFME
jgi:hypothetical protein